MCDGCGSMRPAIIPLLKFTDVSEEHIDSIFKLECPFVLICCLGSYPVLHLNQVFHSRLSRLSLFGFLPLLP
jgi:hypothetical protein